MSAVIIRLSDYRNRGDAETAFAPALPPDMPIRFHFWAGASGRRYVHTVYSLFDCPAVASANYILARRESEGQRTLLAIGRMLSESPSVNLADIRQRAATLGANEVHIHLLASDLGESEDVETDIRTAQPQAV